jgi:putative transposase
MCKTFDVSETGYFAWLKRKSSERRRTDTRLKAHIRASYTASDKSYGSPRVLRDLRASGERVGRKRVARLMREDGLYAIQPKRFRKTTDSAHTLPIAPNLVQRRFDEFAPAPNRLWVSDLTYIWTQQGWLYLCAFIDVYSRQVVGWSIEDNMSAEMVCRALQMGLTRRWIEPGKLIIHTDRGSQYASDLYRNTLQTHNITPSMSRKADCWDNAIAESFWGTLKRELIDRYTWQTKQQAIQAIQAWIANFYNRKRRHSSIGYLSPVDYEILTRLQQAA